MTIPVGLIGYGYWGPNLARNLDALPGLRLAAVCDSSPTRLALAAAAFPAALPVGDWRAMLADPEIAAVVLATPADCHYGIALAALEAGKHLLVEKPLAETAAQAATLAAESRRRGVVLMVDHTYLYSGAFESLERHVAAGGLGALSSYHSVRWNHARPRHDATVLGDLAVHDLAILDRLFQRLPVVVSAQGESTVDGTPPSAILTAIYPGDFRAEISVSWVAGPRTRLVRLGGQRGSLVWDDLDPARRLTLHGASAGSLPHDPKGRDVALAVADREPLRSLAEAFRRAIAAGVPVPVWGDSALRIARTLDAALLSLQRGGTREFLAAQEVAV